MSLTRRKVLTLMASALAAPAVMRPRPAFADTITPLGTPKLVDGSLPGPTANPVAASRGTAGFVITFLQGTFPNTRAFARYFNTSGMPLGPSVQYGGSNAIAIGPVAFANGTVMAVFSRDDGSGNGFDVYGQRFSAARTPVGSPIRLNQMRPGFQLGLPPLRLPNGNFAEAWFDFTAHDIGGRVFTPLGIPVTGDKVLTRPEGIEEALGFNDLILTYRSAPSLAGPTALRAQRLDANLNRVGLPINLDSVSGGFHYRAAQSDTHADGSFTIVWVDTNATGKLIDRFRHYSATGTLMNSFVVPDGQNLLSPELAELALASLGDTGKIGVLQSEQRNISGQNRYWIWGSIVDPTTGSRTAGPVRITPFNTGLGTIPRSLIQIPGGILRFLCTYTSQTSAGERAFHRSMDLSIP
ncbi:MAG: hypothetical protein ACT4SY_02810 [Hyphomicrobiales bacterium]